MRISLYMDDYETEKIFSYLRWLFLAAAALLFYLPALSDALQWNSESFPVLLSFGLLYMTAAHIALHKMNYHHVYLDHWIIWLNDYSKRKTAL